MMRQRTWESKVVALLLLLALPVTGRGQEFTFSAPTPPPDKYVRLVWDYGGQLKMGYWFTAEQVQKIDLRIDYLETRAAKECGDACAAAAKEELVSPLLHVALIVGGVVLGLVGGYFIGKAAAK